MAPLNFVLLDTTTGHLLLNSVIFSAVGIVVLLLAFWIIEKATPENMWKEIVQKQNMALAVLLGAFILGLSIIIAASLHG